MESYFINGVLFFEEVEMEQMNMMNIGLPCTVYMCKYCQRLMTEGYIAGLVLHV